jgi:hypothetical protein
VGPSGLISEIFGAENITTLSGTCTMGVVFKRNPLQTKIEHTGYHTSLGHCRFICTLLSTPFLPTLIWTSTNTQYTWCRALFIAWLRNLVGVGLASQLIAVSTRIAIKNRRHFRFEICCPVIHFLRLAIYIHLGWR